jgi:hypothetical protein
MEWLHSDVMGWLQPRVWFRKKSRNGMVSFSVRFWNRIIEGNDINMIFCVQIKIDTCLTIIFCANQNYHMPKSTSIAVRVCASSPLRVLATAGLALPPRVC